MKRCTLVLTAAVALLVATFALPAQAGDDHAKDKKEVTITGEAKCAKCALHESKKCQSVIQTEENGKTVTYYLTGDKAREFHHTVCETPKKVTATGTVKTKDDKEMLAVSKIEVVK